MFVSRYRFKGKKIYLAAHNKVKRDRLFSDLSSRVKGSGLPNYEKVFVLRLIISRLEE